MPSHLSDAQGYAIRAGRPDQWLGTRETGVMGSTMDALERRGLAEVRVTPRRFLYRLTSRGNELRVEWLLAALGPVEHTPIRVRCTHCGHEAPDGTPGGSCHVCGLAVEAIAV